MLERLDRRWVVMLVTSVFALTFSVARLNALGGNQPASSSPGTSSSELSRAGLVSGTHSPGYDGQFFYRLALRPWTQTRTEFGITFDEPAYRQQRLVYRC